METNKNGNEVVRSFDGVQSRYFYDDKLLKEGWKQYDTTQDASYFGVWVNVGDRKVLTYCEGDTTVVTCPTVELFQAELDSLAEFYGDPPPAFTVISDGKITEIYDPRPTA